MNGIKHVVTIGLLLAAFSLTGCASVGLEGGGGTDFSAPASGPSEDVLHVMDRDSQGA
jgi:hypothetical protein